MDPWFTEQTAGLVGALIGGIGGGVFGGIGGPLAGVLAPKGKAKGLVMGMFVGGAVIGVALAVVGVVALTQSQPWHVWFPFLMGGITLAVVMGSLSPVVLKRYAEAEARRFEAESLRRG